MITNKRIPTLDGLPIDMAHKGGGKSGGLGISAALMSGGLTEILGVTNATGINDVPSAPAIPDVTTGETVETSGGATISEADSARTIRRRKTIQGTSQFKVPLANKGVGRAKTTTGTGVNS